jgi:hypothetical protein
MKNILVAAALVGVATAQLSSLAPCGVSKASESSLRSVTALTDHPSKPVSTTCRILPTLWVAHPLQLTAFAQSQNSATASATALLNLAQLELISAPSSTMSPLTAPLRVSAPLIDVRHID